MSISVNQKRIEQMKGSMRFLVSGCNFDPRISVDETTLLLSKWMANIIYFTVRQSWRDPSTVKSYSWPTSNPVFRWKEIRLPTTRNAIDFFVVAYFKKFQHRILSYGIPVWNCKYQDNNSRTRCGVHFPRRTEDKTGIKWNIYTHSDYQKHKVA